MIQATPAKIQRNPERQAVVNPAAEAKLKAPEFTVLTDGIVVVHDGFRAVVFFQKGIADGQPPGAESKYQAGKIRIQGFAGVIIPLVFIII